MSDTPARPIRSVYYRGKTVVVTTASKYADNAVCNAVRHMQVEDYNAHHCEVFDSVTGKLWAVLKGGVKGIHILYKAPMTELPEREAKHDN